MKQSFFVIAILLGLSNTHKLDKSPAALAQIPHKDLLQVDKKKKKRATKATYAELDQEFTREGREQYKNKDIFDIFKGNYDMANDRPE